MSRRMMTAMAALCLVAALALPGLGCGGAESTLEMPRLRSGPISGVEEEGIWSYKGIPFAAPPVGELRWREPQPVEPWKEVLACREFAPACPQPGDDWTGLLDVGETSEDCLYLNVWTPAASPGEKLPVMVWIHGGAYVSGAASLPIYDGRNLSSRGMVVVTTNYRLGALGFMAHPLLSAESPHRASGNYGLLDQVAALEWVRDNIAAFGGDPDEVTVFGESAGGMSILNLMCSPPAEGLFHRAIVQSGPLLDLGLPINRVPTLQEAERTGERIARELGTAGAEDELAALRAVPAQTLVEISAGGNEFFSPISFGPSIDGRLIPERPSEVLAAGRQHPVPLLTGINADEGTIFLPDFTLDQALLMLKYLYGEHAAKVEDLFPAASDAEVAAAMQRLVTELGFAASARLTLQSTADAGAPAYLYYFDRAPRDPRSEHLGVFHGLEIMYVFGTLEKVGIQGVEEEDHALSRTMMDYWTAFARGGDPNVAGLPPWPEYEPHTASYQVLGVPVQTSSGLFTPAYELMREINGL